MFARMSIAPNTLATRGVLLIHEGNRCQAFIVCTLKTGRSKANVPRLDQRCSADGIFCADKKLLQTGADGQLTQEPHEAGSGPLLLHQDSARRRVQSRGDLRQAARHLVGRRQAADDRALRSRSHRGTLASSVYGEQQSGEGRELRCNSRLPVCNACRRLRHVLSQGCSCY